MFNFLYHAQEVRIHMWTDFALACDCSHPIVILSGLLSTEVVRFQFFVVFHVIALGPIQGMGTPFSVAPHPNS
jgi:hypothetical protein